MIRRLAQLFVIALVLVFWGIYVSRSWGQLQSYPWHVDLRSFGIAVAAGMLYWLLLGVAWQRSLQAAHGRLTLRAALGVWLRSMFMRYLPGNIWHVMGRVYLAEQRGQSKRPVLLSAFIEQILTLVGSAIAFAVSLPFWPAASDRWLLLMAIIPAGLVALHPIVLDRGSQLLVRVLRQVQRRLRQLPTRIRPAPGVVDSDPVAVDTAAHRGYPPRTSTEGLVVSRVAATVTYGDVLRLLPWYVIPNVFGGVSLAFCLAAVGPLQTDGALALGGIFAAGWMVGFLSFLTPSGLGVREGALALMLTPAYGPALAIVASLVSRLALTVGEVLLVVVWQVLPHGSPSTGFDV